MMPVIFLFHFVETDQMLKFHDDIPCALAMLLGPTIALQYRQVHNKKKWLIYLDSSVFSRNNL